MNTDAFVALDGDPAAGMRALMAAEEIARAQERTFSRFIPESELCRLNASAGEWTDVSRDMSAVLELAYGLHVQTGGLFDPAILPDLERAGYDRSFESLPEDRRFVPAPRSARHSYGEVGLAQGKVRLPPGMRIDLGGIVKGWTADLLADRLGESGPCVVELGGDAAVRGAPQAADGWDIGVHAPGADELFGVVRLRDGGVATSGVDARRWKRGSAWAHHLIDPRTREPSCSALTQVTAFAERTAFAEVGAKAALIAGVDESARILAAHPELQLLLVDQAGTPSMSADVPFVYGPPVNA